MFEIVRKKKSFSNRRVKVNSIFCYTHMLDLSSNAQPYYLGDFLAVASDKKLATCHRSLQHFPNWNVRS